MPRQICRAHASSLSVTYTTPTDGELSGEKIVRVRWTGAMPALFVAALRVDTHYSACRPAARLPPSNFHSMNPPISTNRTASKCTNSGIPADVTAAPVS